ncbi:MAG: N-acetyl-alpha-D-glucosaminyl L-malate synthase BshA [Bacteroidetes bacterium]|nr:N-acetyl-alpha-D-glucosaminyl L-malate synthase BshA [Bacteroidota bacterium]
MKIGIICYPTFGGSGVVATELGKAMADKGHKVHFITYNRPFRLDHYHENIYYHEVNVPDYPLFEHLPYETALAGKLVDVTRFDNLDLVHVHYAIPHASAALFAKNILAESGKSLPVITTLHGTDITLVGRDNTYAPVVEYSINKSDGVTAVSKSLKEETEEFFNIKREIEVIPNFIDFTRFSKLDKDHFKKAIAPNDEKILIHVSNFRKLKRVDDVIRVFNGVRKEIPCKLLLAGDGPERANIETLCRNSEYTDDIRFLGKQEAIEELLAVSDLFIMPSASESFGLAALEGMACRVPLISSNIGGLPEINIHGKTGFLSDLSDAEDMTRNALLLLKDDDKLNEFKEQAYLQARKFDIETVMPVYEKYYEKVIQDSKSNAK